MAHYETIRAHIDGFSTSRIFVLLFFFVFPTAARLHLFFFFFSFNLNNRELKRFGSCIARRLERRKAQSSGCVLAILAIWSFLGSGVAMTLVAGSYEKFIWGFSLKTAGSLILKPLFSYPSHLSTIKCVAVSGPVAVSGGADDAIKIYDLSSCSEVGSLMDQGAVTALSFYNPSSLSFPRNLLSGSDGGTVSIYDADPFVHLKTIKVHKKGINDLTIHPSGTVALSVGRDSGFAMLNLVRGRRSYFQKIDKEATILKYDLEGGKFFMVHEEKVSIHNSEDAKLVLELENQKRILCIAAATNGLLFTGGEDRNVTAWDTNSGQAAYCLEGAHASRVKGIVILSSKAGGIEDVDEPYLVASASSDGVIRVWDVRMARKENPTPLAERSTKSRLTCLAGSTLKSLTKPHVEKRKRADKELDEDE